MTTSREQRPPWEYAGEMKVGDDVPLTSEPREEVVPGMPRPPREPEQRPAEPAARMEERTVEASDADLAPQTNQRVTEELREVIGTERVTVPSDRPRASRGEHPSQTGAIAYLNMHRWQWLRATAILLTFAAIVALATGDWWLLPLAAGIHALATMTVTLTIIRMTSVVEHPAPEVAAALAEEGVRNPDEYFSRMVEEFRGTPQRGAAEVLAPGFNERTTPASLDPAAAAAEQSSAMTPTAEPSRPGGEGGAPDLIIWSTTASLFLLSAILPAVMGGGWLWLLPAVMVPLIIGWVLVQRLMVTHSGRAEALARARGSMVAIVVCTGIAVAVFCAAVAYAFH